MESQKITFASIQLTITINDWITPLKKDNFFQNVLFCELQDYVVVFKL